MFYALIVICAIGEPACDVEHALYAEQSPPLFSSPQECFDATVRHLHDMPLSDLRMKEGESYHLEVTCERATDGA